MAFVYEINGQRVEFEKEPTEKDIDEAARQLGPTKTPSASATTLPKAQTVLGGTESSAAKVASRAALADTALNAVTGTWDMLARGLATPFQKSYGIPFTEDSARTNTWTQAWQEAKQKVGQPIAPDFVGRQLGITGTQEYAGALQRQAGEAVAPVIEQNVIKPAARAMNVPEEMASDIIGIGTIPLAPAAGRLAGATARGTVSAVKNAPEFTKGVIGQASGKGTKPGERASYAGQYESARQPAGTTYHKPENLQAWREGLIDTDELNRRAVPYTPEQAQALSRTGGMVPYSGQVARATGEALVEPYTKFSGYIPDVALGALGYGLLGPLGGAALPAANLIRRGVKLYDASKTTGSMRQLGDLGFSPLFPEELAAIQKGQPNPSVITPATGPVRPQPEAPIPNPMFTQPVAPQLGYTPAGESPINMGGPGRRVNIEGESYNLPYQINVSDAQTARPQPNVGPTAEQLAAQQAAERARISEANKLRVAQQLEEQRNAAQPAPTEIPDTSVKPTPMPEDIVPPAPEVVAQPKQQRPMTAAEIRRKLPRREGETSDQFESRVQDVLKARPMVDVEAPPTPKETGKRSYTRQEDRIREAEAKLTAEERAAQEAEVERQLAKSRGKPVAGKPTNTETVSTESLKAKMSTPEQTAMDEATRARLEQLGLLGKKKTPPKDTMEMTTGIPDVETAARDVLVQTMRNPGEFYTTYQKGGNVITETKRPGYHGIDIEFPDGTIQRVRKHQFGDTTSYSSVAEGFPGGQAQSFPSTSTKPTWWSSIEDDLATSNQPKDTLNMAQARVGDIVFDKDAPVNRTQRPDITSAKVVDTPAFKQVYDSQADWAFDNTFAEMAGQPLSGKYLNADKTKVIEVRPNERFDPTDIDSVKQFPEIAYNAKTGQRTSVGDKWTENDPAPLEVYTKARNTNKPYDIIYEDGEGNIWAAQGNYKTPPKFNADPDLKITDRKYGKIFDDDLQEFTDTIVIEGVNKKNGNIVEIDILSPNMDANGIEFNYREFASGKLPKALFKNVPFRQTTLGTEIVDQIRFVPLKDGKPIIENGKVKTEIYYDRLKENLDE